MLTAHSILVLAALAAGPSTAPVPPVEPTAAAPQAAADAEVGDTSSSALRSGVLLFVGIGLVGLAFAQRRRQQPADAAADPPRSGRDPIALADKKSAPSATAAADWSGRREALSDVS